MKQFLKYGFFILCYYAVKLQILRFAHQRWTSTLSHHESSKEKGIWLGSTASFIVFKLLSAAFFFLCSTIHSTATLNQLIKLYEQPYKYFRAIELIIAELDTDLSLCSRNSSLKTTINAHIEQQTFKLQQLLIELQRDKDELDTYLIEDFRYLQNLICGLTIKYRSVLRQNSLIFNALHESNAAIREMILKNDEFFA